MRGDMYLLIFLILGIFCGYFIGIGIKAMILVEKFSYYNLLLKGKDNKDILFKQDGIILNDLDLLSLFEIDGLTIKSEEK